MDPAMKPKYLTPNNGYWVYQRRVPEDVLGHPYGITNVSGSSL
jgi:hypothetical protein